MQRSPITARALPRVAAALLAAAMLPAQGGCMVPAPSAPPVQPGPPAGGDPSAPPPAGDPNCYVERLEKSALQGLVRPSPDGSRWLVNKEDENGIAQIYIGPRGGRDLTCITCVERPGGPRANRFKMQPVWHPSGRWIFLAVERDKYSPPPLLGLNRKFVEGQLQSGLFTNMWVVTPDGREWHRLSDFASGVPGTPDGFTGPAVTPDGRQVVWSQIVDGNILKYRPFGRWELMLADFVERNGRPTYVNPRDITPRGMSWNEPGSFAPDGVSLLITGSTNDADQQGQDQYILGVRNGRLTNLTNTPKIWDEHGVFTPDGEKVIWMSSYPYRDDPRAATVLGIKTEFMLMDRDGRGLAQLTRFRQPGAPEYPSGIAAVADFSKDGRTAHLATLLFPKYEYWDLVFRGPCGSSGGRR